MKKYLIVNILFIVSIVLGQVESDNLNLSLLQYYNENSELQHSLKPANNQLNKSELYNWQESIDATWGFGLATSEKLAIFDKALDLLDKEYACYFNLNVNLDLLINHYRPEIESGVSRGRFAAIMNKIAFLMTESHTQIVDTYVSWHTAISWGTPLFVIGGFVNNDRFGAALTPLPDGTLLVYRVLPKHTLKLEVGDIILGYDGKLWKDLYKEILEAELPMRINWTWGSTEESMTHCLLQSAGLNWHLFNTIDIIKHSMGDTIHLPTQALANQTGTIWGNEQLPVPGVNMPDFVNKDYVSWGVIENTNIGYIYVASWDPDPAMDISNKFYEAIHSLMYEYDTDGLIVDFRLNYGGYMPIAHKGYSLLFNDVVEEVSYDIRSSEDNHFDMQPHPFHTARAFTIFGDTESFYDKPIAVLTGPGAVSNGDWESLRMKFHPKARVFGKPSSGAFSSNTKPYPDLGDPAWFFPLTDGCGYLIDGHKYLAHTGTPVDENVWLTKEDVINGDDTVVKAALSWIYNSTSVNPSCVKDAVQFELYNNYPNPFNPSTNIEFALKHSTMVDISVYNTIGEKVVTLTTSEYKKGLHSISWNGTNQNNVRLSSGAYFVRMKTPEFSKSIKVILLQ